MASHTPGPWRVAYSTQRPTGWAEIFGPNNKFIAACAEKPPADALLIAAAPDMLAALRECDEFADNYVDVNDGDDGQPTPNRAMSLQSLIQSVIAKAEGRG